MKRINIKGTVNQKNIISGVVHRGGGEGGGVKVTLHELPKIEETILTATSTFDYVEKDFEVGKVFKND